MGKLVGIIGAGIGLAKEYQANRKTQSQSQATQSYQESNSIRSSSRSDAPPPYSVEPNQETTSRNPDDYNGDEKSSDLGIEHDEEDWDLDDAQDELLAPEESIGKNEDSQVTVNRIVQDFVHNHPGPSSLETMGKLPYPVIIPQRRPHNKERGFIRAYAPDLLDCRIDQDMFLDFIGAMNKASKASPIFDVINIGAMAAGFVPSATAAIVSMAVGAANKVAKSASLRRQTNGFIDKMNENLFKPHGLFCFIMTFKSGQKTESRPMDISQSVLKAVSQNSSRLGNFRNPVAGKTIELPEAAPLIFPALDQVVDSGSTGGFKGFYNTVGDYMDKRAQAKYNQNNPDSSLATTPQFASRYGDPSHAANSGGLISLATGGRIGRERRGGRGRRGRRGKGKEGRGGIKRLMQEDVLYLMIVNMPSEAEVTHYGNGYSDQPFPNQGFPPEQGGSYASG